MTVKKFNQYILKNSRNILDELWKKLKNETLVVSIRDFQLGNNGTIKLILNLKNLKPLVILIQPTIFEFPLSVKDICENIFNQYLKSMEIIKEDIVLSLILEKYGEEFFEKLTEVTLIKLNSQNLRLRITAETLFLGIDDYKEWLYERPFKEIANFSKYVKIDVNNYNLPIDVSFHINKEKTIKNIAYDIYLKLFNKKFLIKSSVSRTINKYVEKYCKTLNQKNCRYLINKYFDAEDEHYYLFLKDTTTISPENGTVQILLGPNENIAVVSIGKLNKYVKIINDKRFQGLKISFDKILMKYNVKASLIRGSGIYFDKTRLDIIIMDYNCNGSFTINQPFNSNEWFEEIQSIIEQNIEQTIELTLIQKKERIEKQRKKTEEEERLIKEKIEEYSQDFLMQYIVEFVKTHKEKFSSEDLSFVLVKNRSVFNYYSKHQIKNLIAKLKDVKVLKSILNKNKNVLTLNSNTLNKINIEDFNELTKSLYTDFECKYILYKFMNKEKMDLRDYLILLNFFRNKPFLFCFEKEFLKLFKNAPESVKSLIVMKIDTEEETTKKKFFEKLLNN